MTPGVPAFAAAAATLRRELTLPEVAQTVILTRHSSRSTAMPAGEELAALAGHRATLVLHLAVQAIEEIAETLTPHYGADCPAVVVARASWPDELVLSGTLATAGGPFYFDVAVTDGAASNAYQTLSLYIVNPPLPPLVITNVSLPSGTVGVP